MNLGVKILTLNTWQERGPWQKRWDIILKGLEEHSPDIAAFQEVFNRDWAKELQVRSGYEHLIFPEEPGGEMLLSRFPPEESECLTMKTKSPTEDYDRYALYAKFSVAGRSTHIFNTHLSWRLEEGDIRKRQVEELGHFIRAKAGREAAFVVGDFNAPPESLEIQKMMLESGFMDLFNVMHPKDPGLTWNNMNPFTVGSSVKMPDRRIDYIFVRGISMPKLQSAELVYTQPVEGLYASDHFGVLAAVDF